MTIDELVRNEVGLPRWFGSSDTVIGARAERAHTPARRRQVSPAQTYGALSLKVMFDMLLTCCNYVNVDGERSPRSLLAAGLHTNGGQNVASPDALQNSGNVGGCFNRLGKGISAALPPSRWRTFHPTRVALLDSIRRRRNIYNDKTSKIGDMILGPHFWGPFI
ncbi:hypothetical protein J2Y55_004613 [Bosea sp. BE125]|nr:hypothetical protein [Bosea sp. BE125]